MQLYITRNNVQAVQTIGIKTRTILRKTDQSSKTKKKMDGNRKQYIKWKIT